MSMLLESTIYVRTTQYVVISSPDGFTLLFRMPSYYKIVVTHTQKDTYTKKMDARQQEKVALVMGVYLGKDV